MAYTDYKYILPIAPMDTHATIQSIKCLYSGLRMYFTGFFTGSDFKPTDLLLREQSDYGDDDSRILMPRKFIFTDIYNSLAKYLADQLPIDPQIDYDYEDCKKLRAYKIEVLRHWNGLTFDCGPYDGEVYNRVLSDKDQQEDEDGELHICYSELNYFSIARGTPSKHEIKIGKALRSIQELYGHEQIEKFTSDDYGGHELAKAMHEIITSCD